MDLNKQIEEFDRIFIRSCEKQGLTPEETKRALFNDPMRQKLVNAVVLAYSAGMKPQIIIKPERTG